MDLDQRPEVLDRVAGRAGELVLRRDGEHFEVIENGIFLMDTRNGESERLLVRTAVEHMPDGGRVLIGGLGVGFSLAEALAQPRVREVVVIEREPAVINWNLGPLAAVHGDALHDPRVRCVEADLTRWLAESDPNSYDALCLDIDNGPDWTVSEDNAALYAEAGLDTVASALASGGVLAVWSASASLEFEARLRQRFDRVSVLRVPVPRGEPDVVFVASQNVSG